MKNIDFHTFSFFTTLTTTQGLFKLISTQSIQMTAIIPKKLAISSPSVYFNLSSFLPSYELRNTHICQHWQNVWVTFGQYLLHSENTAVTKLYN